MADFERLHITQSEAYKTYIKALCRLACVYVPKIRKQFAEKAFELYQNETIRRLVIAYGEELEKLEESRLRDFTFAVNYPDTETSLEDTCLSNAGHFAETIKFFFLDK